MDHREIQAMKGFVELMSHSDTGYLTHFACSLFQFLDMDIPGKKETSSVSLSDMFTAIFLCRISLTTLDFTQNMRIK